MEFFFFRWNNVLWPERYKTLYHMTPSGRFLLLHDAPNKQKTSFPEMLLYFVSKPRTTAMPVTVRKWFQRVKVNN